MSGIGHNSDLDEQTSDELRQLIERVERLLEEKKGVQDDITDVMKEAKSRGFCTKTMRQVIRRRAVEREAREEADMLLETYEIALGLA